MLNRRVVPEDCLEFENVADLPSAAPANRRGEHDVLVNRIWTQALAMGDCFACVMSAAVAMTALAAFGEIPAATLATRQPWLTVAFLTAGIMLYFARRGHYRHRHPFWTQARHVGFVSGLALLACLFPLLSDGPVRPELPLTWLILPVVLLAVRRLVRIALARLDLWCIRILVIGDAAAGAQAQTAIHSESGLGYEVAGVLDIRAVQDRQLQDRHLQDRGRSWRRLLREHRAELLLIATEDVGYATGSGIVDSALKERVPLAVMPLVGGVPVHGAEQLNFFSHDVMLLKFRNNLADPLAIRLKRFLDLSLSVALLLAVAPIFCAIALLVRRDGGPAMFAHSRVGANGRIFRCLKFRTMVTDADEVLRRTLATNPAAVREWAQTRKLTADPRVTGIGHVLRRTSLDELPQLLNILRGEMSLVGPRPIVREEVPLYGRNIDFYYGTRPGLTGLWQVSGRSDTSYKRRVELDVWYVKNWTAWNDLAILCMTFSAVLFRKGAR